MLNSPELTTLLGQLALSFLGACAGVRIAEDILHWRRTRVQKVQATQAE